MIRAFYEHVIFILPMMANYPLKAYKQDNISMPAPLRSDFLLVYVINQMPTNGVYHHL